jgi:hypothetical protein
MEPTVSFGQNTASLRARTPKLRLYCFAGFKFSRFTHFNILPLPELENGCYVLAVTESGKPRAFFLSLIVLQKQLCLKTSEMVTAGVGSIPII